MLPHDFEDYLKLVRHVMVDEETIITRIYDFLRIRKKPRVQYTNMDLSVKLFRRITDEYPVEDYLEVLYPENLFVDVVNNTLYYKGKDKSVYIVNFEKIN